VSECGEGLRGQGRRDIEEDVYRSCMYSGVHCLAGRSQSRTCVWCVVGSCESGGLCGWILHHTPGFGVLLFCVAAAAEEEEEEDV
jgi:hypothetical protein